MTLFSALQKFITKNGQPVEGASVLVKLAGSATAATLYATRDGGSKGNPFLTLADGNALCYVSPGRYDMTVTFNAEQITFSDVEVGPISQTGSFAEGGTVTDPDQLVEDAEGNKWRWSGALNYTFAPGEDPEIVVGWVKWVDAPGLTEALRNQLNDGDALIYGELSADVARASKNWAPFYVEKYRGVGFSDSETIQAALNAIGVANKPCRLIFDSGRTYTYNAEQSIGYINNLLIDLNGATLQRADGSTTSTTTSASFTTASTTVIPLTSVPANWKVGEYVTAFTSDADADTSRDRRRITAIGANSITISGAFSFSPAKTTLPAGTTIAKNFSCFAGRPSSTDSGSDLLPGINSRIFIRNGTIDGNAANQLNKSWRFCTETLLHSAGGVIDSMWFKDTIGECFVGHGVSVKDSLYEDMGGSCYHTSVNDVSYVASGRAYFLNNTCRRLNLSTQVLNGHSEGAITFSWNPGDLVVAGNQMEDGEEFFLGAFAASTGANSGEFLQCYGNIVKGFKGIFDTFGVPAFGISITGNVFHDCADNAAKTRTLGMNANCTYSGNTHTGTTIGTNVVVSDLLKVGIGAEDKPLALQQAFWAGLAITPAYTNPLDAGVVSILENETSCFQAIISEGTSGTIHYSPGGTASGSAFNIFNPGTNIMTVGTNITGGITEIKAGGFTTKIKASANGVELLSFNGLFLGPEGTDGTWRISISSGDLVFAKRVGGSYVVKNTISGA